MRLITFAGPPSVGKTSVILRTADLLQRQGLEIGVVKFDALATEDDVLYARQGLAVVRGLAGSQCPDHHFATNIGDALDWGCRRGLDVLFSESAGLCNRCAPHIQDVPAVCVVDVLAGVHTPRKIGPMLRLADVVVITKGDIVSQVEREVYAYHVRQANPKARLLPCNGLTGQGALALAQWVMQTAPDCDPLRGRRLRFSLPSAVCSFCVGETALDESLQRGHLQKMSFGEAGR